METVIRKHSETDERYGSYPEKRPTAMILNYGVIVINKPKGPTSHQVSAYVQQILGISKSGHSGTLDPHVTGVLPVALDKATRIVQTLLPAGKEYVCLMHVHDDVEEQVLRAAIASFIGQITQLPPVKSAVKREERQRSIYYLEVLEIDGREVLFRVGCQAGTYIRKLCHDIGQKLGVGAHMAELVRTKAGPFDESSMVSLDDLRDAFFYYKEWHKDKWLRSIIKPVEDTINMMQKVWITDSTVEPVCHGTDLNLPGISKFTDGIKENEQVAIVTLKGELVALGIARLSSKDMLKDKGVAVKIHKVFMEPGTYPKVMNQGKDNLSAGFLPQTH
ncbi:MAG: RNA-guided pseudouridylation complex pseudouridine synthase subunit Cbf5 [Candidatus Woesearchaeota archaeon]